jgi:hypothetical protein
MDCKLVAYCNNSPFQNNTLWNDGDDLYKSIVFADVELARPKADVFQEINENRLQDRVIIYQRQRMEQSFYLLLRSYCLDFFAALGLNDVVELHILSTGETYILNNLRMEDNGDVSDVVNSCVFTFDNLSVTGAVCGNADFEIIA